jgi:hypothetical protein
MNTAKAAADTANQDYTGKREAYLTCMGPAKSSEIRLGDAQGDVAALEAEANSLRHMNGFLLGYLRKEATAAGAHESLRELATGEKEKLSTEIERLKSEISTERRRFLDSGPQVSPAVGGFYFTRVPDNQVLIAFIVCFGAFLLFGGVAVLLNSFGIQYVAAMTMGERVKVVLAGWALAVILSYIGLLVFT